MLKVQEVRSRGVRQEVEEAKYTRADIRAPWPVVDHTGPRRQLADKGNKVQAGGQSSVDQFLEW